ncbi:MAG: hypothetical protein ACK50L_00295 [Bacteroidota bacterium]
MTKISTTLLIVLFTISISFGQTQNATTESGKKVILSKDGTWKYADTLKTSQSKLDPNDCANWVKTTEDKVAGTSFETIKDYLIVSKDNGKKGFGIDIMKSSKGSIILSIKAVGGGGCIDKGQKVNILFTDGTRLELLTDGDFNCKGKATMYFGGLFGKKSELSELQAKTIDIMRVWTSDSYVEEKFTNDQAAQFKNALNCLSK